MEALKDYAEKRAKLLSIEKLDTLAPSYLRKGFPVPKWITFSKILIKDGWTVKLFRSKSTYSKYLYISKNSFKYKIRFSNHKANRLQETRKDSDFYVGVGNNGVLTTEELLKKLIEC